jgi:hypothetical protein
LLLLLAAGCGSNSTEPAPVSGKVSFRGTPLSTGTIVFTPDPVRGFAGPPVCAEIQTDGGYQLQSADQAGVAPGVYRVTVAAVVPGATYPGQSFAPPQSLLPDKYRDPDLSGLTCEVKAGRPNAFNFNLE